MSVPLPDITKASNSEAATLHKLSSRSISVTSCPSEIRNEARFNPTLPPPLSQYT